MVKGLYGGCLSFKRAVWRIFDLIEPVRLSSRGSRLLKRRIAYETLGDSLKELD